MTSFTISAAGYFDSDKPIQYQYYLYFSVSDPR